MLNIKMFHIYNRHILSFNKLHLPHHKKSRKIYVKMNSDDSIFESHRSIFKFSFMNKDTKTFGSPNFESLMLRKLDIFLKIIKLPWLV